MYRYTLFIAKKLGEVPLYTICQCSMLCILQKDKQWMGIFSIHMDLGEHVKLDVIALNKFLYLLTCAWLLTTKLITGEGKNTETFFSIPESSE